MPLPTLGERVGDDAACPSCLHPVDGTARGGSVGLGPALTRRSPRKGANHEGTVCERSAGFSRLCNSSAGTLAPRDRRRSVVLPPCAPAIISPAVRLHSRGAQAPRSTHKAPSRGLDPSFRAWRGISLPSRTTGFSRLCMLSAGTLAARDGATPYPVHVEGMGG
jgi:hypothetical protein